MTALDEIAAERRIRVTFEVDEDRLNAMLHEMNDRGAALGLRIVAGIVAACLGAESDRPFGVAGMDIYGVTIAEIERIDRADRAAQEATDAP